MAAYLLDTNHASPLVTTGHPLPRRVHERVAAGDTFADVAELLAERGVRVDPSTISAWVRECAPLYEDAARSFRRAVGSCWSVDETYTRIAGQPAYVYRAIDGHNQVVDGYVSTRRATAAATAFFRRAIEATGVIPDAVTTDGAAAYPPALAAALPPVAHEIGKAVQQRIERTPQHLKGRVRPLRGFKTLTGARGSAAGTLSCGTCVVASTTSAPDR